MVINITLGRATLGRAILDRVTPGCAVPGRAASEAACGFAGAGLVAASCANAVHPAVSVIATAKGKADQRVDNQSENRRNIRLLRRRLLLLRAPRLLVCLRRESVGGQRFG